jgi:Double sensory domain of two-component sensor kinase
MREALSRGKKHEQITHDGSIECSGGDDGDRSLRGVWALCGSLRGMVIWISATALLVVAAAGVLLGLWGQRLTFNATEQRLLETQGKVIERLSAARVQEMSKLVEACIRPHEIQNALAAKDREELMDNARPPFNRRSSQTGLTHLAYYDPAGSRLLALPTANDSPESTIVQYTLARKQTVSGIERSNRELVLPVVQPIYRGGELLGVVQVGMALRRLTQEIAQTLSVAGVLVHPRDRQSVGRTN